MRTLVRLVALLGMLTPMVLAGCDGSPAPAMGDYVEVKGTVTTADGRPLKSGGIFFKPDGPGGREEATQVKDGAFELKMFVAKYKVAFDMESPRPGVPARYTKFDSSGQSAEVKGGMDPLVFSLR